MEIGKLTLLIVFELLIGPTVGYNATEINIDGPRIVPIYSETTLKCGNEVIANDWIVHWYFYQSIAYFQVTPNDTSWIVSVHNTILTIHKIEGWQAGSYICYRKHKTSGQYSQYGKMFLQVVKFIENSNQLTPHTINGSNQLILKGSQPFQISVYHGDLDMAVEIVKKPNVSLCEHFKHTNLTNEQRSCMGKKEFKHRTDFYVENTVMEESDWFDIKVSYGGTVSYYSLQILIQGRPKIVMLNETMRTGETVDFVCRGHAYPPPDIEMTFTPCLTNESDSCEQKMSTQLQQLNITKSNDSILFTANGRVFSTTNGIVTCNASNSEGIDTSSFRLTIKNNVTLEKSSPNGISVNVGFIRSQLIILVLGVTVILLILTIPIAICSQKTPKVISKVKLTKVSSNSELIIPQTKRVSRKDLIFGRQLGEGEYGVVLMAEAKNILPHEPSTTVAIKMMRYNDDDTIKKAMLAELRIIILIGQHLNIVNFLGAVDEKLQNHDLMIVLEYCPYGNVLDFMRINKENFVDCSCQTLEAWRYFSKISEEMTSERRSPRTRYDTKDLICWSKQIADGMAFLKSKNVCHGDLAARNVLLCEKNVVKISDFGLARAYNYGGFYKKTGKDRLPYKWLALESMSQQIFNVATDVWSYGVLLWELFSLGVAPYPGIPLDDTFYTLLVEGYRMEKPRYANGTIYDIMCMCWKADPKQRPSFANLTKMFNAMLPSDLQDHYKTLNDPYNDENNCCLNDDNQGENV